MTTTDDKEQCVSWEEFGRDTETEAHELWNKGMDVCDQRYRDGHIAGQRLEALKAGRKPVGDKDEVEKAEKVELYQICADECGRCKALEVRCDSVMERQGVRCRVGA